jgi:O-antigen/teichoic acid export membrane protein
MTTIRRQSIFSLFFIYAGFLIGALNVLYLFPKYFTPEQFGLTRLLLEVSLLLSTLCAAGMVPVSIKFFPFHKQYLQGRKNDLLFITLSVTSVAVLLLMIAMPMIKPMIIRKFGYRSPLFVEYFELLYPLTIGMTFFSLFEGFAWILRKTILSNFLKEFLFRALTTLLIFAWVLGIIPGFPGFAKLFSLTYLPPLIILVFYVMKSGSFPLHMQVSPVTRRLGKKMAGFGLAFFASSTLNALAKTNDSIIIASQSENGLVDTAVFNIATYLITLMEVPQRSLTSAATPQIALAWKDRNMERLKSIYKKTALNLMVIGMGLISLILLNVGELVEMLGPIYAPIANLILILGAAKIIDMGTGMNSQILMLSKHWKIDLFSNMLFVVISLVLNFVLTKKLGVMGPAWGGLIAIIFFNVLRFTAIWKIYGLQPFTWRHVSVILLALISLGLCLLIPSTGNWYLNIIIPTLVFTGIYGYAVIKFKVSQDINELVSMALKRFSKFNN